MKNKKTTKRALLLSVVSMFICFTMLLGTTYAWFTDSVTSTGNIIKTGTLDVTLEYKTALEDTAWQDASTGEIFNYSNWEPGYTQVRYVKVENVGTLDLKFRLNILPAQQPAAGEVDLADVIDVYMMTGEVAVDRNTLAAANPVGTLASLMADGDGAAYGELLAPDQNNTTDVSEVYTIVLKMQEGAGNEYQDKSIGGSFIVQLIATQLATEADDLDDESVTGDEYDKDATYPTVMKVDVPANTTEATPVTAGKATVKIPAGADAGEYEVAVSNENVETDENDNTTVSFDLEVKKDGAKVAAGNCQVDVFVGKNLNLTKVTHNGEDVVIDSYDPTTGIVTFTVNSFSPFAITYYSGVIENVEDLANIAKGGNFVLAADIDLAGTTLVIPENKVVNLDLNGKTITGTKGRDADNNRIHVIVNNGILTIKDGTVKSAGNDGGSAIYNNAGATLTIEDVTLYGAPQSDPVYEAGVSKPYPSYAVNNYGNAVVNGATVKSYHGAIATGGNGVTVINDADIDVGLGQSTGITSYAIYSYENAQVTVNGGKFAFTKQEIYVNGGNTFCELGTNPIIINGGNYTGTSFSTGEGREYVIKGGTFDVDPSAFVADGYTYTQSIDGFYIVYSDSEGLEGTGTADDPYLIKGLGDLIWFRDNVNTYTSDRSNQYVGKYVKLTSDIDLAGLNWEPIGYNSTKDHMAFMGTFDGDGHTIYNLYVNADSDHLGFFARVGSYSESEKAVIKNINFHNVDVSSNITYNHGGSYVAGVVANAGGNSYYENVNLTGDIYVAGYGYIGGIVGHGYPKMDRCTVTANSGSYINCYYWSVGAIVGFGGEGGTKITNSSVVGLGEDGLYIWGAYGAAAAVCGNARDGATGENLYASNVEISGDDYALGYIFGNSGILTNVSVDNVRFPEGATASDANAFAK